MLDEEATLCVRRNKFHLCSALKYNPACRKAQFYLQILLLGPLLPDHLHHRSSLSIGPWELNNLYILTCLQFEPPHAEPRPIAHLPSRPTSFPTRQHSQIAAPLPLCFQGGDFSLLTALSYKALKVKPHRLFHFSESSSF